MFCSTGTITLSTNSIEVKWSDQWESVQAKCPKKGNLLAFASRNPTVTLTPSFCPSLATNFLVSHLLSFAPIVHVCLDPTGFFSSVKPASTQRSVLPQQFGLGFVHKECFQEQR
eukprot:Pompholyxophrys_sp_v1_NODE_277_length_874_cov_1.290598.p1 type:complete len:114 gc:universal NODE_277_length_874_cov_1.290598:468-809(+)